MKNEFLIKRDKAIFINYGKSYQYTPPRQGMKAKAKQNNLRRRRFPSRTNHEKLSLKKRAHKENQYESKKSFIRQWMFSDRDAGRRGALYEHDQRLSRRDIILSIILIASFGRN